MSRDQAQRYARKTWRRPYRNKRLYARRCQIALDILNVSDATTCAWDRVAPMNIAHCVCLRPHVLVRRQVQHAWLLKCDSCARDRVHSAAALCPPPVVENDLDIAGVRPLGRIQPRSRKVKASSQVGQVTRDVNYGAVRTGAVDPQLPKRRALRDAGRQRCLERA
eukprot:SAG31_NODE_379_length_16485_cov_3.654583_2_plen_165_part_00